MIELHYDRCHERSDLRMFVEILGLGVKLF